MLQAPAQAARRRCILHHHPNGLPRQLILPGRLPGDIIYRRGNFTFYFPVVTSILLSLILTFLFWFFRRR